MDYRKITLITCTLFVTTFVNRPLMHAEETKDYTVVMELPRDNFTLDHQTGEFSLPQNLAQEAAITKQISYVPPIYPNPNSFPNESEKYAVVMELPADHFNLDERTGQFTIIQKTPAARAESNQSYVPPANFNPRYNSEAAVQYEAQCQKQNNSLFASFCKPCTPCQTDVSCQSSCQQEENTCVAPGTFRAGLEFAAGRFIALDQNYGGVTFLAVPQSSIGGIHPLFDIRAFKLENRNWAASAGLGFRKFNAEDNKVYGINFFYDYRNQRNESYHQWGFGLELLSGCWEVHLNGYLPVGKTQNEISKWCQQFDDGFYAIFRKNEFALRGLELTGGGRWSFCDNLTVYVAPGFYMYNNNDLGNIQGIQCVAEINWNDWLSFRLNSSYDSKFRGRVQGIIELSIPFNFGCNACECCCCESFLGRPIRRNDMIFFKSCTSVERNFDDCGLRNCSIR